MLPRAIQAEAGNPELRLNLFGTLRAVTAWGHDALPKGRKAQAILVYLALSPDRSVPRFRLVELLWSGRWQEQGRASLRQALIDLRRTLGSIDSILTIDRNAIAIDHSRIWIDGISDRLDDAAGLRVDRPRPAGRLLETLEGIDRCFDEWIAQCRATLDPAPSRGEPLPAAVQEVPKRSLPAQPGRRLMVTVAPMIQLGPISMDEFVLTALTQELVTALARFRWIGVRYSPRVGEGDYRIEGYLAQGESGLRVVTRLIDQRADDVIVWTGESTLAHPLGANAIVDLVEAIIVQIDPEILAIETRKALGGVVGSHEAYSRVLRALGLMYRFEEAGWREAVALLGEARAIDPNFARAHVTWAMCSIVGIAQGWSEDPRTAIAEADRAANLAISLDPRDSLGLALSAHIRSFVHHDFATARTLYSRAISANPSCGISWGYSALTHAYMGEIPQAEEHLNRARTIMIHDPFLSHLDGFRTVLSFFARDWEAAAAAARIELALRPRFDNIRKLLIGALCQLGRYDEARHEDSRLRTDDPLFSWNAHLAAYPFHDPADRESLRRALSCAGLCRATPAPPRGRSKRTAYRGQARTVSTIVHHTPELRNE